MEAIITLIVTLAVFIAVLLICREIYCWYTKANERVELQRQILAELKGLRNDHKTVD